MPQPRRRAPSGLTRGGFGAREARRAGLLRSIARVTPQPAPAAPLHTVAIVQVRRVLAGARHRGVAVEPLLERAGIAPALLASPLARVSQAQYAALLRTLRRALRDELWGLASRPLRPGSFGQIAMQLVGTATLDDALRRGFALAHLLVDDFTARLDRDHGLARVRLVGPPPADDRADFARRAFMLFAHGLACWLVARRVPLVRVEDTASSPGGEASRVYQAPVRRDCTHIGLVFEARWLSLPVVQSRQSLREFLAQAPANLIVRYRDNASTSERIRRLLRRNLGGELPSLDELASQFATTPQTLRRRLRAEGRGFRALKDELRRDAAIELLAQPELTIDDIGHRLGFSEASAFHRAFKHWTGVAPGAYRQSRMA